MSNSNIYVGDIGDAGSIWFRIYAVNDDTVVVDDVGVRYTLYDRTVTFYTDPSSGGTISWEGVTYSHGQSHVFEEGCYSPVTAVPASGNTFLRWTSTGGVIVHSSSSQSTVVEINGGDGTLKAWFNRPPYAPSGPSPSNGQTGVSRNADLLWTGGDPDTGDTVYYDVYFEAGDSTPDILVSNHQTSTTYDPGTMGYSTTYYWKIIAFDNHGASTTGPVWRFTTTDPPQLCYSTSSINFGTYYQGDPVPSKTFEIWNCGGETLTYSLSESIPWMTSMSPTSGTSTGEHDTITIGGINTQTMEGYYEGYIYISSNGGSGSVRVYITVIKPPHIEFLIASYDFGSVYLGQQSTIYTFQLKNTGGATATGTVTSSDPTQFPIISGTSFSIPANGGIHNVQVQFRPQSIGQHSATITADGTLPCNDAYALVTGTGVPSPPHLMLTPQNATFPDTYVGGTSPVQYFTLTNTGDVTATGNIYLTNDSHFTILGGPRPFSLAADQSTTINVTFTPASPGPKSTVLKADGSNCDDNTSTLTGIGLSHPPLTPVISGETFGYLKMNITFTFTTTDPDGDPVFYRVDWDDNTPVNWTGPYPSGGVVTVEHSWNMTGSKNISVQAKDGYNCSSSWTEPFTVTIYPYSVPHYAVVIGEWDYPGNTDDIVESLCNAHSISSFLGNTNEWTNTVYRTNRGATGIMSDLTWMKNQETSTSLSLFYYSGHGTQIVDDDPGEEADGLDEALYCSDGNIIRDDDLKDLLDLFEGPVVVILESCNSGGMPSFWKGDRLDNGLLGELSGENRVIMTACNETEFSHIGDGMMSVFTNYIRIGWNGAADVNGDIKITDKETFVYARTHTLNYAQSQPWTQTPQLFDGYGGDIPLIVSGFGQNIAPGVPTSPSPYDGEVNVSLEVELSCNVSDLNGDTLMVGFFWGNGTFIGVDSNVSSGDRASIVVSDLNDGETYTWYVLSSDGMNVTVGPVWTFSTTYGDSMSCVISLSVGWNLVTIPVVNDWWASTLAENISGCELVSWFDPQNQTYRSYVVGGPPGLDFPIRNGYGIFILVNESSSLNVSGFRIGNVSVPLFVGWDMIGWYHEYSTNASTLGAVIPGCEMVSRFDAVNQTFKSYIVGGPPGLDFTISCGMGLFVLVDVSSVWHGEG
ncbi:MAG: choice-of-anchor D domain-containing protein [Candidatus Thermoplasmatota archaeon]